MGEGYICPLTHSYEYNICALYVLYGLNVRNDYTKHRYCSPKCALRGHIYPLRDENDHLL